MYNIVVVLMVFDACNKYMYQYYKCIHMYMYSDFMHVVLGMVVIKL